METQFLKTGCKGQGSESIVLRWREDEPERQTDNDINLLHSHIYVHSDYVIYLVKMNMKLQLAYTSQQGPLRI